MAVTIEDDGTGEKRIILTDAVGQGIDAHIYRTRGIASIVLVDSITKTPIGPSAEVEYKDLVTLGLWIAGGAI